MLNAHAPRRSTAALMLVLAAVLALASTGCQRAGFLRQYEYDEDIYLALDGTASIYINASYPALAALRGAALDPSPSARFDRAATTAIFESPGVHVARVTTSRQHGRRFLHVRLEVADIRKLATAPMFSWATIRFDRMGELYRYREDLGAAVNRPVGDVGWKGDEVVAFRLHLPSKIAYHNAGKDNLLRGNILLWEQTLTDRLRGAPLEMEARMEPTTILYSTLWLFLGSMLAAFSVLGLIIWWVVKKGKDPIAG